MSEIATYSSNTEFSHVKKDDTKFLPGGLRDFFVYKDLGVAKATKGKVIAHIAKANLPQRTEQDGITTSLNFKSYTC